MMQRIRNIATLVIAVAYLGWGIRLAVGWSFDHWGDLLAYLGIMLLSGVLALFCIMGAQSAGTRKQFPLH